MDAYHRFVNKRLPRVTGARTLRALRRAGWYVDRHGRHTILRHPRRGGIVVVPNHPGESLPPGTLKAILEQAGLTIQAFRELL
ncbi:MAG TPA: type II toxin-antitoxin system HicA family toxin [Chloroflexota bacterium]